MVVWEHTLGAVGNTYMKLLEIYWVVNVPNIINKKLSCHREAV